MICSLKLVLSLWRWVLSRAGVVFNLQNVANVRFHVWRLGTWIAGYFHFCSMKQILKDGVIFLQVTKGGTHDFNPGLLAGNPTPPSLWEQLGWVPENWFRIRSLKNVVSIYEKHLWGRLGGSVSWASNSWFQLRSLSQGHDPHGGGIQPHVRLHAEHGACLRFTLSQDAWVAQSVKHPTWVQTMISQFLSLSLPSGSVLTAQSLDPASDSVSVSLCAPFLLTLSLKNK